ncbi:MAG: hypothetical protein KC684_05960 [Candidatus Omnitrophica bacterium]|nr:hypothetical protein [Candidatus Omnitrophota bacterium]
MKTITLLLVLTALVIAAQPARAEEKKAMNLDAENIRKAAEIMQKNKALFQDPEALQRFVRLSQSLKKSK